MTEPSSTAEAYEASIDQYLNILHEMMDQYDADPRPSLLVTVISRHNYIRGVMYSAGLFEASADSAQPEEQK